MTTPSCIVGVEDLVPETVLQDLADSLAQLAGLPLFFARPDGRLLTRMEAIESVCCRITTGEGVDRPCVGCERMTYGLDGTGWPDDADIADRHSCPTGLQDIVLPIRSGGRVVALIGTPQVATQRTDIDRARRVLSHAGAETRDIARLLAQVVSYDEERLDDVRRSVRAIAELVLSLGGDALRAREDADRLGTMARTDALTGLENRRQADIQLASAWSLARRHGRPFGVILFDIDHFKRVNDTLGHATGDRVLVALAQLLARSMRRSDRCFRFGGEEFLVVCHESDAAAVRKAAERNRAAIGHTSFSVADLPALTVSAGTAAWPDCAVDGPVELVAAADAALYAAKGAGRDRVACAESRAVGEIEGGVAPAA